MREKTILVYVNNSEHKAINQRAKQLGLAPSVFLRFCAIQDCELRGDEEEDE